MMSSTAGEKKKNVADTNLYFQKKKIHRKGMRQTSTQEWQVKVPPITQRPFKCVYYSESLLYLLFLSELFINILLQITLAAKPPTILYLFMPLEQAAGPRCAYHSCFCSVIVRCSTHNCIMEKQLPTRSKQCKQMTFA